MSSIRYFSKSFTALLIRLVFVICWLDKIAIAEDAFLYTLQLESKFIWNYSMELENRFSSEFQNLHNDLLNKVNESSTKYKVHLQTFNVTNFKNGSIIAYIDSNIISKTHIRDINSLLQIIFQDAFGSNITKLEVIDSKRNFTIPTTYSPQITQSPPVGGDYVSYARCVFSFTSWTYTNEYSYRSPLFIQFELYLFNKMVPPTSRRGIRIYGFRLSHCESGSLVAHIGMNVAVNGTFTNSIIATELKSSAIEAFQNNITIRSVEANNPILIPFTTTVTVPPVTVPPILKDWEIAIIVIIIILIIALIPAIIFGLRYHRNKNRNSSNNNGQRTSVELGETDDEAPYDDFSSNTTSQSTFSTSNPKYKPKKDDFDEETDIYDDVNNKTATVINYKSKGPTIEIKKPGKSVDHKPVPNIPKKEGPKKPARPPTEDEDGIDIYDDVIKTKPKDEDEEEDPYEDVVKSKPKDEDEEEDPYEDVVKNPTKRDSKNKDKQPIVNQNFNDELTKKLGTLKRKPPVEPENDNLAYEDDEDIYNEKADEQPDKLIPKPRQTGPSKEPQNLKYGSDNDEESEDVYNFRA